MLLFLLIDVLDTIKSSEKEYHEIHPQLLTQVVQSMKHLESYVQSSKDSENINFVVESEVSNLTGDISVNAVPATPSMTTPGTASKKKKKFMKKRTSTAQR